MRTNLAEDVYGWMREHADEDGNVLAASGTIAAALERPTRTVLNSMQKLQQNGKIVLLRYGHWVVVELAEL